jgi:methionyl-tRNA formyltransferase
MKPFRLIFMGTPHFALPTLQHLVDAGQQVVAVYTQPPRPTGRGHKLQPSPVHQLAESHGIPVHTPKSLKSGEEQKIFADYKADAAIVAAYGLLLPPAILQAARLGCINVHPSKLPRWRGAAPLQRQIMAGDTETAMTIMQMNEGLDTGDILLQKPFPLSDEITVGELHDHMAKIAGPMVIEALEGLALGTLTPQKQEDAHATYAPKIDKAEALIDWHKPAREVLRHIHGLSPYPAAHCSLQGEVLKILKAVIVNQSGKPGTVLDDQLTLACGEQAIRPVSVQRAGKKPMDTASLLRGFAIPAGTEIR